MPGPPARRSIVGWASAARDTAIPAQPGPTGPLHKAFPPHPRPNANAQRSPCGPHRGRCHRPFGAGPPRQPAAPGARVETPPATDRASALRPPPTQLPQPPPPSGQLPAAPRQFPCPLAPRPGHPPRHIPRRLAAAAGDPGVRPASRPASAWHNHPAPTQTPHPRTILSRRIAENRALSGRAARVSSPRPRGRARGPIAPRSRPLADVSLLPGPGRPEPACGYSGAAPRPPHGPAPSPPVARPPPAGRNAVPRSEAERTCPPARRPPAHPQSKAPWPHRRRPLPSTALPSALLLSPLPYSACFTGSRGVNASSIRSVINPSGVVAPLRPAATGPLARV